MQNLFNSFNNLVDRRNIISKSLSSNKKIKSKDISFYLISIACVISFFILLKAIPLYANEILPSIKIIQYILLQLLPGKIWLTDPRKRITFTGLLKKN